MILYATHLNGDQVQYNFKGDQAKILKFINDYQGDDLGNDLALQSFVDDVEPTGVVIFAD